MLNKMFIVYEIAWYFHIQLCSNSRVPHTGPGMWYEKFDVNNVYPQLENNPIKSLDFVDTILLDYLIQNSDRNALFYEFSTYSSIFLLDHGKR